MKLTFQFFRLPNGNYGVVKLYSDGTKHLCEDQTEVQVRGHFKNSGYSVAQTDEYLRGA